MQYWRWWNKCPRRNEFSFAFHRVPQREITLNLGFFLLPFSRIEFYWFCLKCEFLRWNFPAVEHCLMLTLRRSVSVYLLFVSFQRFEDCLYLFICFASFDTNLECSMSFCPSLVGFIHFLAALRYTVIFFLSLLRNHSLH